MYNSCMFFGDVIVKQVSGIAMGMSPIPTLANLLWPYTNRNMSSHSSQLWCCIFAVSLMTEWAYGSMPQTLLQMTTTGLCSRLVSTKVGYSGLSANTLMRQSSWTYGWRSRWRKWQTPSKPNQCCCISTFHHTPAMPLECSNGSFLAMSSAYINYAFTGPISRRMWYCSSTASLVSFGISWAKLLLSFSKPSII